MDAAIAGPVQCPVVWPYNLSEEGLSAYLQAARTILSTGRFRSIDSWSKQAGDLVHQIVDEAEAVLARIRP